MPLEFEGMREGQRTNGRAGAVIYCQGALGGLDGKTAHGLIRRSHRYEIQAVIDSDYAGSDAGELLDGRTRGIPVVESLAAAMASTREGTVRPTHFVLGLAPIGGELDSRGRVAVREALRSGLHVHSGLHEILGADPELASLARDRDLEIVEVRRSPPREELHAFCGKIAEVRSPRVAVLGSDSGIGKRTTAWMLVDELRASGHDAELIGTGQTAWLQGAVYCTILDSLAYDFVPGEIEHVVWRAWRERRSAILVLEGQGGLLSPGYFGGQELLAAARPEAVVFQHAPARAEYDGCPGFAIESLERQLAAVRALSDARVVGIALCREGLEGDRLREERDRLARAVDLPVVDVLGEGVGALVSELEAYMKTGAES